MAEDEEVYLEQVINLITRPRLTPVVVSVSWRLDSSSKNELAVRIEAEAQQTLKRK